MVIVSRSSSNGESPRRKSSDKQVDTIPTLAREPDLIAAIERDIAAVGLVGEEDAGLLVYLAYSSRKLDKPLSVIIKGPSGSGKDQVQRRPAELMPPEDIIDVMSATPQTLYYGAEGWLKNKILLGGERCHQDDDAQRDRTAAIRQLLSNGYITKQTVREGESVHIRQDGPVSYSETTTQEVVFAEDASRCLQVRTDDSEEMTVRVRRTMAERCLVGGGTASAAAKARERHRQFQKALQPADVVIPYAVIVSEKMTSTALTTRRVFTQVTSLIRAVACLHQFGRGRGPDGSIEATLGDYALVRKLALGPLYEAVGNPIYSRLKPHLDRLPVKDVFTTEEVRAAWGSCSRKVALDRLNLAVEAELVRCVKRAEGKNPSRWSRVGNDSLLPTVQTVEAAMRLRTPG